MVKKLERNGKDYYICELCNVAYTEEEWANERKQWCSEHFGTCSIKVVQHAARIDEENHKD